MLFHIQIATNGVSLSCPEIKGLMAFLVAHDENRPLKSEQIGWIADMNAEAREAGLFDENTRIATRSSAPYDQPVLCFKVLGSSVASVFELIDGDLRKMGLPFDFPDHVWFRFTPGAVEINGLTDEDWILARLSDTQNALIEA